MDELRREIADYLNLNGLSYDLDDFILKLINVGFNIEKYGTIPSKQTTIQVKEKIVEKKVYVTDEKTLSECHEVKDKLIDELDKMKLSKQEIEIQLIKSKDKLNKLLTIINENHVDDDIYGEENEILKLLKNEIEK